MARRENREAVRFSEMGRAECPKICALNGVLDDISLTGCCLHFPNPVSVDMEDEYNVRLRVNYSGIPPVLDFRCKPMRIVEGNASTEIGFRIMKSPSSRSLSDLISLLEKRSSENSDSPSCLEDAFFVS